MRLLVVSLLAVTALSAAQGKQTFVGTITDDMCERADHSRMQMGPTDAECTRACVAQHGAAFVLFDGTNVYKLSDQKTPDRFAGQKVRVTGTVDAKTRTIRVESISAAK
jgi:Protein of unknown function (DUF5818)